jgi:hypothetical protein
MARGAGTSDAENQINDFDSSSTVCDVPGDESMSSTTSMEGGVQLIPHQLHHEFGAESHSKDVNSTFTSPRIFFSNAGIRSRRLPQILKIQIEDLDHCSAVGVMSGDEFSSSTMNMVGSAQNCMHHLYLDPGAKPVFNEDLHLTLTKVHGYDMAMILMFVVFILDLPPRFRFRSGNTDIRSSSSISTQQ